MVRVRNGERWNSKMNDREKGMGKIEGGEERRRGWTDRL
jgi:hypothetical protein